MILAHVLSMLLMLASAEGMQSHAAEAVEDRRAIYAQDCEFHRYQDGLRWSRYQTAALIEAGLLYCLFRLRASPRLKMLLLGAGSALVLTVTLLSVKDEADAMRHLKRIRAFEEGIAPFPPRELPEWFSGKHLMVFSIIVLNGSNLVLMYWGWRQQKASRVGPGPTPAVTRARDP